MQLCEKADVPPAGEDGMEHLSGRSNAELSDDALTGGFRLFQRNRGHRYSIDDVLTAAEACCGLLPPAARILDLGCGIGSVLCMVAWHAPRASLVGIEAQLESHALAQRNVARNGLVARTRLIHGDLRDSWELAGEAPFDLVTGTPPYFPPGTGTQSGDAQRAAARFELRGGIEAYLAAAVAASRPGARIVMCVAASCLARTHLSAEMQPMRLLRRVSVIPREGCTPLFHVCSWEHTETPCDNVPLETTFVARSSSGERTGAYHQLRGFFGLGPEAGRVTAWPVE